MKPAVVLLSGGMDSAVVLAIALAEGYHVNALSFDYGQRHILELEAAGRVAKWAGVRHVTVTVDPQTFAQTALTGGSAPPTGRTVEQMGASVPPTYVPARNTIFLSYALAWAETLGSRDIFAGMNGLDYGGYPDCRPEYVAAFERMANLATAVGDKRSPLTIHTPVIHMDKKQIVRKGLQLGVPFCETASCYDLTSAFACGDCDACRLRLEGFAAAGIKDPVVYR